MEAVETMKMYIAHNMDDNEELRAKLEMIEGELTVAQKLVDERVGLLRKIEEGKEATKVEARRMAEEKEVMEVENKKAEEEAKWLR